MNHSAVLSLVIHIYINIMDFSLMPISLLKQFVIFHPHAGNDIEEHYHNNATPMLNKAL